MSSRAVPFPRVPRGRLFRCMMLAVAAASSGGAGAAAGPQVPAAVLEARALEDEGRLEEAADRLLAYLREHPDDPGVHWRAAQLLRGVGRPADASPHYAAALALSPADPWLRLEHAGVLAELGELGRARDVVLPLADDAGDAPAEARVQAIELLGTLAWWRGDLSAAVRRFEAALALAPGREPAAGQLREIRRLTRPWVRMALEGLDDDQPYRRAHAELGVGLFATPLWTVGLEVVPRLLDAWPGAGRDTAPPTGSGAPRSTHRTVQGLAVVKGFVPAARLDLSAGLGGVVEGDATWLGRVAAGLRLPGSLAATVGAERERYLWTLASADTLVVLERVALTLGRPDHPGWAGEAALRRETFADGNALTSASAWFLAPVAPGVRIGWAASLADARESRWSAGADRYLPYYTPEDQHVQSLLAEVGTPVGGASVRVSGRYGVWATEQAPATGSAPLTFVERSYHPWSATAGLEAPATDELTVYVRAERSATAFYALTRVSVALLVRLGSGGGS